MLGSEGIRVQSVYNNPFPKRFKTMTISRGGDFNLLLLNGLDRVMGHL